MDLGLALTAVIWAYDGFASVVTVAGEVRDPSRNLQWAILLSITIVTSAYLLLNIAYVSVLGLKGVAAAPAVASQTMQAVVGPFGAKFVALMVMTSTFATVAAQMLGGPRVLFAMAEERLSRVADAAATRWADRR